MSKKPNVVLFMVDQLSAKWLELAGEKGICDLPNLDWLAGNGTTFTSAFTSNPMCSPARATILTGQTSRGHGLLENGYALDSSIPTFTQAMQRDGWRTGAFGKVHLRPHYESVNHDNRPYGYDVTHVTEDDRGGEWLDWVEKEHPDQYEAALSTAWPDVPGFSAYGPAKINLAEKITAAKANTQRANSEYPLNNNWSYTLPFPEEVSQSSWITSRACDFLHGLPGDTPFFANISYVAPHPPFCPPSEYMDAVDASAIPEPLPAEWLDNPDAPEYFRMLSDSILGKSTEKCPWLTNYADAYETKDNKRMVKASIMYARHCYFADIVHLDTQLGRVKRALEDNGVLENTYIIFTSDHGELLADKGFWQKGARHYDACIRIPLVIAGPGLQKGVERGEFVQLQDICPTVLDMAQSSLPSLPVMSGLKSKNLKNLYGASLIPLCKGEKPGEWRQEAYVESYNQTGVHHPGSWARTIRTAKYRYTFYPGGNGEQLFNMEHDKNEEINLADNPEYQGTKNDLMRRLMELIILQDYPMSRRDLFAFGVH